MNSNITDTSDFYRRLRHDPLSIYESTRMKVLRIGLIVAMVSTPPLLLGVFWWWALFGMTPEVGLASAVTILTVGFGSTAALDLTSEDRT